MFVLTNLFKKAKAKVGICKKFRSKILKVNYVFAAKSMIRLPSQCVHRTSLKLALYI